jgi:hypothetical protein
MKTFTLVALVIGAFATLAPERPGQARQELFVKDSDKAVLEAGNDALKETLIRLEKQSWEAWKKRDGKYFQEFLSQDHVEVGFSGVTNKAAVVTGVASPICVVSSYSLDHFELTAFNANTALLTYHAEQDTACNGNAVPSPVWASSLYVKRGDRWLNALYQQTQAGHK